MQGALAVALGGALGAVGRYGISLLPVRSSFPVLTLATNLLGALLIGFIVGMAENDGMSGKAVLFWKTGVCGGFTTFSTFSLEALTLLEKGKTGCGILYAVLSVILCIIGVWCGQVLARRLKNG